MDGWMDLFAEAAKPYTARINYLPGGGLQVANSRSKAHRNHGSLMCQPPSGAMYEMPSWSVSILHSHMHPGSVGAFTISEVCSFIIEGRTEGSVIFGCGASVTE